MHKLWAFILLTSLSIMLAAPAFAQTVPAPQGVTGTPAAGASNPAPAPVSPSGGIQPVSPQELSNRVSSVIDKLHGAAAPVVNKIGELMTAVSALILLFAVFAGMKLLLRVFGALLAIGCGLILFAHASTFVGVVNWISQSLGRH